MEKLEAIKQVEEIQNLYKDLMGDAVITFSALVKGIEGSGKTLFSCTGRKPILVDLFDPKGSVIFHTHPMLKEMIEKKELLVRPYTKEISTDPTEYIKWQEQWQEDCKSGFLSMFGTYVIDSGTTMLEAMSNYTRKKKGRGDNLAIQDYIPMYNAIMDMIKFSSSQGCDFIYIGHLQQAQDESTGRFVTELDTYKGLKGKIPKLFSEKYCLVKEETSQGVVHKLLTHSTGRFEASSQLAASGNIPAVAEPNLKELLEKAGLSMADKEIVW